MKTDKQIKSAFVWYGLFYTYTISPMNMIYNGVNVDPIDLQQNIKITTTTKESDTEIDSH